MWQGLVEAQKKAPPGVVPRGALDPALRFVAVVCPRVEDAVCPVLEGQS